MAMKRWFILLGLIVLSALSMKGMKYVSINVDYKTSAVMAATLAEEAGVEALAKEQWNKIFEHYTVAEVASAGIFGSKWLDRQALKKEGIFGGTEENWYYQHIRLMVAQRIMPRIFSVGSLMIKSPDKAIYWGPYLLKVTEEVKQLCMIFQCVCANGKVSFADLGFLAIADELRAIFDLAHFGGVDWKNLWENITNLPSISKDDLADDFTDLIAAGTVVASAGSSMLDSLWVSASKSGQIFHMKPREIWNLGREYKNIYESLNTPQEIKDALMAHIGSTDSLGVARLFRLDNYNITNYISDYLHQLTNDYYRQRWYIYWQESGSEQLASWDPPRDPNDPTHDHFILNGEGGWYKINTNDKNYGQHPDANVIAAAKAATAAACGWSQERCDQLNAEQDWYYYYISQWLESCYIYQGSQDNVVGWSFSYHTRVYRSWNHYKEVYEEYLDTKNTSEAAFRAHMERKLQEFKDQDMIDNSYTDANGVTHSADGVHLHYYIGKDSKQYYSVADENRMRNCTTVSFIQRCDGGSNIMQGKTDWKVDKHHPDWEDYKREAMATSVENDGDDLSQFRNAMNSTQNEINSKQNQINTLEARNRELNTLIARSSDYNEIQTYQNEIRTNRETISQLKREKQDLESQLAETRNQYNIAYAEYSSQSDGCYRIPAIMREVETSYDIEWTGDAYWEGYGDGMTYVRPGKMPSLDINVQFRAKLNKTRGETWVDCWFFSLRTHRSILQIDWVLNSDYSSEDLVDLMTFDDSATESEKTAAVNQRLAELQAESPDCTIELKYQYSSSEEVEDNDNALHLLWMSDRLRIAREVDSRLTRIHAQLVLLEKYLYSKQSLMDYLLTPFVNAYQQGMHGSVANASFRRWRQSSYDAIQGGLPDSLRHHRHAPSQQAVRRSQKTSSEPPKKRSNAS